MEGLEVDLKGEAQVVGYLPGLDLKGEAFGQMSGECQSDLKGEIEEEKVKPLFLRAGGVVKVIMRTGGADTAPPISYSASGKALAVSLWRWWQGFSLPPSL